MAFGHGIPEKHGNRMKFHVSHGIHKNMSHFFKIQDHNFQYYYPFGNSQAHKNSTIIHFQKISGISQRSYFHNLIIFIFTMV